MPSMQQITDTLVNSLHKIIDIISTSTCQLPSAASAAANSASPITPVQSNIHLNTLKVKGKAMHLTISPLLKENFRDQLQNE